MTLTDINKPLVSIIMPTYNHAKFIGGAIESVLNQTYKNFELIIIDNYSEDNTEKIVANYKNNKIKYLKFRNHGIIAASRNYGIKNSNGEYLAFLDSDDEWLPQKLELQLIHFRDNNIACVSSDIIFESNVYYSNPNLGKSKKGYKDYCYYDVLLNNPIATSSVVIKKTDFLSAGGFDENPDFKFIEDWELWLRLSQKGKFRVLDKQLMIYRICQNERDRIDVVKKKLEVINKHYKLGYVNLHDVKEAKASIYFYLACLLLISEGRLSKEYFFMALKITDTIKTKIKSIFGLLFSIQALTIRKTIFFLLRKLNRTLRFI